jgi:hypothetical protein
MTRVLQGPHLAVEARRRSRATAGRSTEFGARARSPRSPLVGADGRGRRAEPSGGQAVALAGMTSRKRNYGSKPQLQSRRKRSENEHRSGEIPILHLVESPFLSRSPEQHTFNGL